MSVVSVGCYGAAASSARVAVIICALSACSADRTTAPAPVTQNPSAHLHPLAFTIDVNARTRAVTITPPAGASGAVPTFSLSGPEQPSLSLLAGDAVRLLVSDYRAVPAGPDATSRIRITFAVAIENILPGIQLVTPTWPTPPADGIILFPVDVSVTLAPGAVQGNSGNILTLEQPRWGTVTPSSDFDGTGTPGSGAPYDFFREEPCGAAASSLCFRWKAFPESIPSRGRSRARTIGFDIDPSVAQFRARLIVAADLAPM